MDLKGIKDWSYVAFGFIQSLLPKSMNEFVLFGQAFLIFVSIVVGLYKIAEMRRRARKEEEKEN